MILRSEANPRGKIPTRSERMGIGDLDGQQTCANRTDGGNFGQALAQFIVPMPSRQLRVDLPYLQLEPGVVLAQRSEQLFGQLRQRLIILNACQQRLDVAEPLGGGQPELGPHSRGSRSSTACGGESAGRAPRS